MCDVKSYNQNGFFDSKNAQSDQTATRLQYRCTRTLSNGKELEIRKASASDYGLVMSVGEIYKGFDYLPSLYHPLMNSGDAHMFLALIADTPVGFTAVLMRENRTKAVHMALRCREGYRNLGIATQLGEVAQLYLREHELNCVRQLGATSSAQPQQSSKYGIPSAVWEDVYHRFTPFRFGQFLHHLDTHAMNSYSVSQLTTCETLKLIDDHAQRDTFGYNNWFPMTNAYIPYCASDPAFARVLDNSIILCSGILHSEFSDQPGMKSANTASADVEPIALSFSSVIEVANGVLFDVFHHGDSSSHTIVTHLRHIIEKLMKTKEYMLNTKDVTLVVNMPISVDREAIDDMLGSYCLEKAWECPHIWDCPLQHE